jgi:hypothetical protein
LHPALLQNLVHPQDLVHPEDLVVLYNLVVLFLVLFVTQEYLELQARLVFLMVLLGLAGPVDLAIRVHLVIL